MSKNKNLSKSKYFKNTLQSKKIKYVAFFDGSISSNPAGYIGYGWFFAHKNYLHSQDSKHIIEECSGFINREVNNTVNLAEFKGLQGVLDFITNNHTFYRKVAIYGDSRYVIGAYKNRDKNVRTRKYFHHIQSMFDSEDKSFGKKISWIPRELNAYADELSKREIIDRKIVAVGTKKLIVPQKFIEVCKKIIASLIDEFNLITDFDLLNDIEWIEEFNQHHLERIHPWAKKCNQAFFHKVIFHKVYNRILENYIENDDFEYIDIEANKAIEKYKKRISK